MKAEGILQRRIAWRGWFLLVAGMWLPVAGPAAGLESQDYFTRQVQRAQAGDPTDQYNLGLRYLTGQGVEKNPDLARRWIQAAATNSNPEAALSPALRAEVDATLRRIEGREPAAVPSLAPARPPSDNAETLSFTDRQGRKFDQIEVFQVHPDGILYLTSDRMGAGKVKFTDLPDALQTRFHYDPAAAAAYEQAEAERLRQATAPDLPPAVAEAPAPAARGKGGTGTGFFVTDDGYFLTCFHVVKGYPRLAIKTGKDMLPAQLVRADSANDLALLKVVGSFRALPLASSRLVKLGEPVLTIGFPNPGVQGLEPKLTKGEISSLAGLRDDPRQFQVSVPVQPGNSGGPLVNAAGNVVGIVTSVLMEVKSQPTGQSQLQNVNYAVKSDLALAMMRSLPNVANRLKAPYGLERPKPGDDSEATQVATALVIAAP